MTIDGSEALLGGCFATGSVYIHWTSFLCIHGPIPNLQVPIPFFDNSPRNAVAMATFIEFCISTKAMFR